MVIIKLLYRYFRFWGGSYKCIVCNRNVRSFFPFSTDIQKNAKSCGFAYDFKRLETLNFEQCNCPFCMSSDRERLYLVFLEKYLLNDNSKRHSVLDFAPSPVFSHKLRKISNYTSTDLFRNDVDINMDICDMKEMADGSFNFIICSHILEHVPDPDKAMREIFRIMHAEGKAIIMVPLFWDVQATVEDSSHITNELRLKHYGQEEHVRLFSRQDFLNRLNVAGFAVHQMLPSDIDQKKNKENAISDNSILYVCSKSK
jgi:SAM-dependent methyltransferase